jgi:hypothetical protein
MSKRVVVIADLHCGHLFGLTPPGWWSTEDTTSDRLRKAAAYSREFWDFYATEVNALKPIDILIVNGDSIEGKGDKSGGRELRTSDRNEQVKMAAAAIDVAGAKTVRIAYGTAYHTGREEDFESTLPKYIECKDAKVEGHLFLDVNGCNFDIKHKVGRSGIPHGRVTPLMRAALWNEMWAMRDRQPLANVVIRSHVHYYERWEDDSCTGIITPALQYNTIFGIRECEGVVNVGFICIDVDDEGSHTDKCILADFDALKVSAESL